jgi:hypothetical protein
MKRTKSLKTIALSLGLAAMLVPSTTLNAQYDGSRGVFGRGEAAVESASRGNTLRSPQNSGGVGSGFSIGVQQFNSGNGGGTGGWQVNTEQFNESPLGSGLFIMAAAGAAYAFSKKRKKQENN